MTIQDKKYDDIITIKNFRMIFGKNVVIDDLSFEVKRGEVFGFLGSNGSGKTTTIRALLGLYNPTAGKLLINNRPFDPRINAGYIGYLPEERGLYKNENVITIMSYFGQLKGMDRKEAKKWSMSYLERVNLADKFKTKINRLSGGQQQKIQLGVTIMNDPDLLILDEPTKGFDPINRKLLIDIIEEQNKRGSTVMMITHQMEEVERLCDRVILLKEGKSRAYGTIDSIKDNFGGKRIMLNYTGDLLSNSELFRIIKQDINYAEIMPKSNINTKTILRHLSSQSKLDINNFSIQRPSLDEIFISIYGAEPNNE